MNRLKNFFNSSIGLKTVVALTGAPLLLFVIGHMLGNLQIFLGQDVLNDYGAKLHAMPALLWVARIGLLVLFVSHIGAAIRLSAKNAEARPIPYAHEKTVQASYASRTMVITGLLVLGFVVLHIAHFTLHVFDSDFSTLEHNGHHDVYAMVVKGFSSFGWMAIYVVCNLALGFHLSHGASSLFQTLGLNHPTYQPFIKLAGPAIGITVIVGNLAIPTAVYFGIVTLPGGGI